MERELLRREPVDVSTPPAGLQTEVWEAVRSLPVRQRTAIALRYVLDYTEAQIAQVMRVRPGTVAATLAAARRRLAELLAGDGHAAGDERVGSERNRYGPGRGADQP